MKTRNLIALIAIALFFSCSKDDAEQENNSPVLEDQEVIITENPTQDLIINLSATDTDGDSLTYTIVSQSPSGATSLNSSTGALVVANPQVFDYEINTQVVVNVSVSDGENEDTAVITISIQDEVDQAPTAENQTFSIVEGALNLTEIGQIVASDPQNLDLSYSIVSQSVNGAFSLDGTTGILSVNEEIPFDYETNNSITAVVAVENEALLTTEITITVNLIDVNYPTVGVRAYYQMNSNTNSIANDFMGNYNGDVLGNVSLTTDRNGNIESAYNFNGGRVRVGPGVLNGLANYTISGWVRPTTSSGTRSVMIKGAGSNRDFEISVGNGNGLVLRYTNPSTLNFNSANDGNDAMIGTDNWVHFAAKVQNGLIWSLYVNGALVEATTFTEANSWSNENLNIGAYGGSQLWQGDIDDIIVYDRLLSDLDISKLANDSY